MKTSMMKHVAYAALAAACIAGIAGCGQKKAKEYAGPKIGEGTTVALACRNAETTSLAPLAKKYKFGSLTADNMSKLPDEAKEIIKELGLDKTPAKWMAVTVGDVSAAVKGESAPEVTVALAMALDLDKTIAVCEKKLKEEKKDDEVSFKKTTVAGAPAYEIHAKDSKMGGKAVVPCVASLDGQLVLAAMSADALAKQIALYRDGKGESKEFGAFALGANDLFRAKAVKVGEAVKKNLPSADALKMINGVVPDGDKIVLGLGTLEVVAGASADGKNATLDVSLETATPEDADKLTTFAKTGLMTLTAAMKQSAAKDADAKTAYGVLQGVKIVGEGKMAKLAAATPAEPLFKMASEKAKELAK